MFYSILPDINDGANTFFAKIQLEQTWSKHFCANMCIFVHLCASILRKIHGKQGVIYCLKTLFGFVNP